MIRAWLGKIALGAALKILPNEVFGLSTSAIAGNLPALIDWVKTGWNYIQALKVKGIPEKQATKAAMEVLSGQRRATTFEQKAFEERGLTWTP